MSPPALTTIATTVTAAAGTVELVKGISYLAEKAEKKCSKCDLNVKKRDMVKHLEDHVDEEKRHATDKGALERKLELMAALEARLREEKAELLQKMETIDREHKREKRRLIKDKSKLKKELVHAKSEEARFKALARSTIRIKCDYCSQTVLAKDRDSHMEIHRNERRMWCLKFKHATLIRSTLMNGLSNEEVKNMEAIINLNN